MCRAFDFEGLSLQLENGKIVMDCLSYSLVDTPTSVHSQATRFESILAHASTHAAAISDFARLGVTIVRTPLGRVGIELGAPNMRKTIRGN